MKKKKLLIFFCVCALFNMAANFAHPVTPTLIVERNLDSAIFGTALAAMQATMFLFPPFWGKLCDYIPTKRIMMISCFGYAVGQMVFGSAHNEIMVYAGRIFAGGFVGGAYTAFSNHVLHISDPKDRGANLTALLTLQTVACALGYFVGGFLGLISVEAAFTAQVLVLILCGILFQFCCMDDMEFVTKPDHPMTLREVNPFSAFLSAKSFLTPMMGLLFALVVFSGIGHNAYEQSFNYYIKDQFRLSSAYNGTIKVIVAVVTIVMNSTVCIYLQKKTDTNRSFLPVLLLAGTPILMAIFFRGQLSFFAAYILYNGIYAIRIPLIQTLVANRATAENSNSVMGFYQSMNSLGSIFGSMSAGLIYAVNPMYPFILACAAYGIACIIGIGYRRKYRSQA